MAVSYWSLDVEEAKRQNWDFVVTRIYFRKVTSSHNQVLSFMSNRAEDVLGSARLPATWDAQLSNTEVATPIAWIFSLDWWTG